MIRLHNTLGRKTQEFKPLKAREVSLYTCGPTVYDYAHIGNLRSFVFDDTLRRTLQNRYKVRHVMNITDVGHLSGDDDEGEDKLEKGANREHKTVWEVADLYIKAFEADVASLNILKPNGYHGAGGPYARATDFINQQIEIVAILLEKGYAYQTEQAIYFDVSRLDDYGKLTGQKLSEKEVAARSEVVTDKAKRHPQDFALWFFKVGRFADHSMSWPSKWGAGFPGWHLECSAIIHATLGEPIDVHTGGVDHIGTHHTNEIAQTEAAYGHQLAKYWLHNEHLLVEGKRMAKSARNFYTLTEVVQKNFDPLALRLLFLQSHYRSQMNFSWEALRAAQANLTMLRSFACLRFQYDSAPRPWLLGDDFFAEASRKIVDHMENDLATPAALAETNRVVNHVNENAHAIHPSAHAEQFKGFLELLDKLLGLRLLDTKDISGEQKELIKKREAARQDQDWSQADELRNELKTQGIEVKDTPAGPIWSYS